VPGLTTGEEEAVKIQLSRARPEGCPALTFTPIVCLPSLGDSTKRHSWEEDCLGRRWAELGPVLSETLGILLGDELLFLCQVMISGW
jgi:hypothetical protein